MPSLLNLTRLRVARGVRRLPLTVGFACALAAAEVCYAAVSTGEANRVAAWASTNVARLTTEPVGPLAASVFVVPDYRVLWLVLGTLGCAIVEAHLGWRRTLLVAATAQLAGTAVSEGVVWWRVGHGRLPNSALHQVDVGVSYVVVGLLSAAVVVGRPLAAKVLAGVSLAGIAPDLLEGLSRLDVTPVGHLTALVVAGIFQWVLLVTHTKRLRIQDWQPTRRV